MTRHYRPTTTSAYRVQEEAQRLQGFGDNVVELAARRLAVRSAVFHPDVQAPDRFQWPDTSQWLRRTESPLGDRLNVVLPIQSLSQNLPQAGDLERKTALFNKLIGPKPRYQLVLFQQVAAVFD